MTSSNFYSSMANIYETEDNEIFFTVRKTSNCPLREPWESDPVVTTLYNRHVYEGDSIIWAAEYDARPHVTIKWKKNGSTVYKVDERPRRGQTQMIINNVLDSHHGCTYKVVICDSQGRKVSSSATIFVE